MLEESICCRRTQSIDSYAFQGLHVAASQNPEMPIAIVKEYLARLLAESCQSEQGPSSLLAENAANGNETRLSENVATFIATENRCPPALMARPPESDLRRRQNGGRPIGATAPGEARHAGGLRRLRQNHFPLPASC